MVVRQDLDEAYRPVVQLKNRIILGGVMASLIISFFLWIIARRVTGPLRAITQHADALRLGTSDDMPTIGSHISEVTILEKAISALLDNLKRKQVGLRELNATLESRVKERTEDLSKAVAETQMGERRVRAIIDTALDAFIGVDDGGAITDWNPRAEEIFGWSREEVLGRSVSETIIPPRYRHAHEQGMERYSVSGSSGVVGKRLELAAIRRDGEEFPVEMTIGLINAGEVHFFGAFVQDISVRKKIERELARERELLNVVLDSIDVGVVVCSRDGDITLLNRAARDLHGLPAEQIPPSQWAQHYDLFQADGVSRLEPEQIPLYRALQGEVIKNAEMTVKPRHDRPHFLFASGRALHAQDGSNIGAVIALKDVTELKESERRLEANERLLRTITDNLPVLIAYIDQDERYQFANATYEKWFGMPPSLMVGKTVREVLGSELYEEGKESLQKNLAGHPVRFQSQVPDLSGTRYVEVVGIPDVRDGLPQGVYVLTSDITASKRHEEELARLARVDTLTGLPNRRSYEERLAEALRRANRTGTGLALMFLDVDHFKKINDTLGHAGGDIVLQEFGTRLKRSVRTTDIVSRLAGDEFTIILEGLHEPHQAGLVAQKVVDAFKEAVQIERVSWHVSTSIGVAFVKAQAQAIDVSTLTHQADTALYRAKANGRGQYAIF